MGCEFLAQGPLKPALHWGLQASYAKMNFQSILRDLAALGGAGIKGPFNIQNLSLNSWNNIRNWGCQGWSISAFSGLHVLSGPIFLQSGTVSGGIREHMVHFPLLLPPELGQELMPSLMEQDLEHRSPLWGNSELMIWGQHNFQKGKGSRSAPFLHWFCFLF